MGLEHYCPATERAIRSPQSVGIPHTVVTECVEPWLAGRAAWSDSPSPMTARAGEGDASSCARRQCSTGSEPPGQRLRPSAPPLPRAADGPRALRGPRAGVVPGPAADRGPHRGRRRHPAAAPPAVLGVVTPAPDGGAELLGDVEDGLLEVLVPGRSAALRSAGHELRA